MATLNKTSTVLKKEPKLEKVGVISFSYLDPSSSIDDPIYYFLSMDKKTFEELGSPEEVTMTIIPEDTITPKEDNGG